MSLSKLNTLWDDYLEQLDKNPIVTKVSSANCDPTTAAAATLHSRVYFIRAELTDRLSVDDVFCCLSVQSLTAAFTSVISDVLAQYLTGTPLVTAQYTPASAEQYEAPPIIPSSDSPIPPYLSVSRRS